MYYLHFHMRKKIYTEEERIARRREQNRKSYEKNKEKYKAYYRSKSGRIKKNARRYELRRLSEFEQWKRTLCCTKCGENHPACIEFHHLDPSTKEHGISYLRNSKKKLAEELKKCIVLCSNCHKKLHYEEREQTRIQLLKQMEVNNA